MLTRRRVTNRFDIVAARVEHEGSVVVRMIVRAYAGYSVIPATGSDRFLMESIDRCAVGRGEGDMCARLRFGFQSDPEERLGLDAIACRPLAFGIEPRDPEWTQRAVIKLLRPLDVGDADRHVIQHVSSSRAGVRFAQAGA